MKGDVLRNDHWIRLRAFMAGVRKGMRHLQRLVGADMSASSARTQDVLG